VDAFHDFLGGEGAVSAFAEEGEYFLFEGAVDFAVLEFLFVDGHGRVPGDMLVFRDFSISLRGAAFSVLPPSF
jgi:hypothetical protein